MSGSFELKIQPGKPIQRIEIGQLVKENDPMLREECLPWMFDSASGNPMPAMRMANMLINTAKTYGAIGLAAPQIGYPYRVFCIGDGKDQFQVCFNPYYSARTTLTPKKGKEGCLSFPGLSLDIIRAQEIDAKFQMPDGSERNEHYVGMTARAFQHEHDHLNGIVFTSYVGEMRLIQARDKRRKFLRNLERRSKRS
jgi:peptide deformylase